VQTTIHSQKKNGKFAHQNALKSEWLYVRYRILAAIASRLFEHTAK
jgi:hypothetical protein